MFLPNPQFCNLRDYLQVSNVYWVGQCISVCSAVQYSAMYINAVQCSVACVKISGI